MDDFEDWDDIICSNISDSSSGDSSFEDIQPYFVPEEFSQFSSLIKLQYRNQKNRYEDCLKNGIPILEPYFMRKKVGVKRKQAPNTDTQNAGTRKSQRLSRPGTSSEKSTSAAQHTKEVPTENVEESEEIETLFEPIRPFFTPTEWQKMSVIAKNFVLAEHQRYSKALKEGLSPPMPKFMVRTLGSETIAAASSQTCSTQYSNASGSNQPYCSVSSKVLTDVNNSFNLRNLNGKSKFKPPFSSSTQFSNASTSSQTFRIASTKVITHNNDSSSLRNLNENSFGGGENILTADSDPQDPVKIEIKNIAKEAVTNLSDITLEKLSDQLIEKGVESIEDLNLVESHWLANLNLNEVQIKKILRRFSGEGSQSAAGKENEPHKSKSKSKKQALPLMRLCDANISTAVIQSRPAMASKLTPTKALDYTIQWGKMRDSLLSKLEKKERPDSKDRENMVLVISKDIKEAYDQKRKENPTMKQKTPGRKVYLAIVDGIFEEYEDCFKDEIRQEVVGNGKFSLLDQFETCIENMYRQRTPSSERATVLAKGTRSAACILPEMYAPPLNRAQKAEAEQIRYELLGIYKSQNKRDWKLIKEKLILPVSIAAQRAIIVDKKRNIQNIMDRWPLMFEFAGMLCHLDAITNSSILKNFTDFIKDGLQDLLDYLTLMSPAKVQNLKLLNNVVTRTGSHYKLMAAVMMLASHFSENIQTIILPVEENTLPHEVLDLKELPSTPCIVPLGLKPFEANMYLLFMDSVCIGSVKNAAEALIFMCAAFFVFGVHYPAESSVTLTYIERVMAGLKDDSGLVKGTTSSGAVSRGCLSKVVNLDKQVIALSNELKAP